MTGLMALSTAVGTVLVASTPLTYDEYTTAEVLRRALATAVSTLALFVIAIGLRLSMVEPPGKFDLPPPVR